MIVSTYGKLYLIIPFQSLRYIPDLLVRHIESEAHDLKADPVGCAKFHDIAVSGNIICDDDLVEKRYDTKCAELFSLHFCRSIGEQSKADALFTFHPCRLL